MKNIEFNNVHFKYCKFLRKVILNELNDKSPLRNKMEWKHLGCGQLPVYDISDSSWVIDEDNSFVMEIMRGKRAIIPIFELEDSLEVNYDDFIKQEEKDKLSYLIDKHDKMLTRESEVFYKLENYIEKGKGIVVERSELTVLPYIDMVKCNKVMGFGIFEQIGAAVLR